MLLQKSLFLNKFYKNLIKPSQFSVFQLNLKNGTLMEDTSVRSRSYSSYAGHHQPVEPNVVENENFELKLKDFFENAWVLFQKCDVS